MRTLIITISVFLGFISAKAQYVNLTGRAIDIETKQWIQNGMIVVYKDSSRIVQTYTSDDGTFMLSLKNETDYVIEISKTGYRKLKQNLSLGKIKNNSIKYIKVYLEPEGIKIKGHVLEASIGIPLVNYKIVLYNTTQKKKKTLRTDEHGEYAFKLTKNQNYTLKLDTIINGKEIPKYQFSTVGVKMDADIHKNYQLTIPVPTFKQFMENAKKLQALKDSMQGNKKDTVEMMAIVPKPDPIKPPKKAEKPKKETPLTTQTDKKKVTPAKPTIDSAALSVQAKKANTTKDSSKVVVKREEKKIEKQVRIPDDSVFFDFGVKKTLSIDDYNKKKKEGSLDEPVSNNTGRIQTIDAEGSEQIFVRENSIFYPAGKAVLNQKAIDFLKKIANEFKNQSNKKILIEIFSDANKELAIKDYICRLRSEEIVTYIINFGIPFDKLIVSIVGNKVLANNCKAGVTCTETQHQENRRSRLTFTADEIIEPNK